MLSNSDAEPMKNVACGPLMLDGPADLPPGKATSSSLNAKDVEPYKTWMKLNQGDVTDTCGQSSKSRKASKATRSNDVLVTKLATIQEMDESVAESEISIQGRNGSLGTRRTNTRNSDMESNQAQPCINKNARPNARHTAGIRRPSENSNSTESFDGSSAQMQTLGRRGRPF